eukprot:g33639.t1
MLLCRPICLTPSWCLRSVLRSIRRRPVAWTAKAMELRTAPTACAPRVLAPGVRGGAPRGARQRPSEHGHSAATGVRAARLHLPAAVMALGAATGRSRRASSSHGGRRPRRGWRARRAATSPTSGEGRRTARRPRLMLLGGCGRIGTAAAVHLMKKAQGPLEVILAGRDRERGRAAVEEVKAEATWPVKASGRVVPNLVSRDRNGCL